MADVEEKARRHSVAVMSTSYLSSLDSSVQQRRRFLADDRVTSSSKRRESTVSKAVDRSNRLTKAPSSVGPSRAATQAAAIDSKTRRHSVAVHPGAAVSVMETSGTRQAAAKARKSELPLIPSSSKVIDDFIDAADKAQMRITPLPAGSEIHRMATLEEIAGE